MKVAVIGASGSTGSLLVDKLISRGHEVVAIARSALPERRGTAKVTVKSGDVTSAQFLKTAFTGCDAVVSCLGQKRKGEGLFSPLVSPPDILQRSAAAALQAIGDTPTRFIYLSAFGVGEDLHKHSPIFRFILRISTIRTAYADHAVAEQAIKASRARWTIIKPPGLNYKDEEKPLVDKSDKWSSFESVSRKSLAAYLAECVEDESIIGKSLTIGAPA